MQLCRVRGRRGAVKRDRATISAKKHWRIASRFFYNRIWKLRGIRGRAAHFHTFQRVSSMTRYYRLLALGAFVGLGVWLSQPSHGEPTVDGKGQPIPSIGVAPRAAQNLE